jgi:GxxExxY protein
MDLLVENSVVVEVKSVDALAPIHEAQVISYLRLSGCRLALLINFNVMVLKDGIRRFINGTI